ncbi:MAG: aminopeptidase P family protein, partial [Thermoplasmata archaeon]|nr:aminopeptidase P family protein [Thermoplasmata archaeon]
GRADVISSPLEEETARRAAQDDPDITVHAPSGKAEREELFTKLAPKAGTIALNYPELTHESYRAIEKLLHGSTFVDAAEAIRRARVVKDKQEIKRLERAGAIGSKVAKEIPSILKTGMTEIEVAAEIEYRMMRAGASGRSFGTIVGFGANSAEPHYSPQEVKLASGMSIVCDFGAYYRRYASDITRSFRFGAGDPELKKVHETVQAAQSAALEIVRAGVAGREVHMAAQKVIDASPFKGRFTHGLGHSIGLAVHDGFGMGPVSEGKLLAGMAVTIEPGIYLPGKGGVRIEDDVLVTERGYRFLTDAPREYIEVAA